LDEPTNDLDTDMLRAMEDLLDTWPGTLIVVSHDRYLLERVTDQQYAILDGEFRHMPGGIDQYLALEGGKEELALDDLTGHSTKRQEEQDAASPASTPTLRPGSKERRLAEKEHSGLQRKIDELNSKLATLDLALAATDTSDYEKLAELSTQRQQVEHSRHSLETRWLELAELLEG
jgi:DNA repair exonuclease SbcCD ATPase subunit